MMTHTRSLKTFASWTLLFCAGVAPAVTAPAAREPVTQEHLSGTLLSLTPQLSYERAELRISGPDGYALSRRFSARTPIVADLLTDAEMPEGSVTSPAHAGLPDGRYRYELVLGLADGRPPRRESGVFFVERGVAVKRAAKLAALGALRRDLADLAAKPGSRPEYEAVAGEGESVDDFLEILDTAGNGITTLILRSAYPPSASEWLFRNYLGDLITVESGGSSIRMILEESGQVGIGTSAPLQELHIDSPDGGDIRLSGSDADWIVGINGGSDEFVIHDETTASTILRLAEGAPADSLVVTANGRIGLGTATPAADFDVQGHVRGKTFASASARALKTGFGAVNPAEILTRLSELPVTSWRYRDDDEGFTHIGPVAEDFQRLFELGDGETISNVDAVGVLMAAVQGLQREVASKDEMIARLGARLTALEAHLEAERP